MKKVEVNKDLLYHYYIEENNSIEKTSELMNLKYRTVQRAIKEYNFNKDRDTIQKQRESSLKDKYGVENVYQLDKSKEKSKETKLNRYGSETYNNSKQQKQTMIDKYGVSCGYRLPEVQEKIVEKYGGIGYGSKIIQDKIKNTNQERYGVSYPTQNKIIKGKATTSMLNTFKRRYGVSSNFKIPAVREQIKNTTQERYGVPYFCMREECYSKNGFTNSKINQNFANLLRKSNINYETEFHISTKSYDFKVNNILIEINPTYTHNSTNRVHFHNSNREPLKSTYHIEKTKLALDNQYRCIHIWDWDDIDKIINTLKPKTKIYARKCTIREVSIEDTSEFLNKYHLQDNCKGQSIRLGLYYNDELIQLMTFGKPRYNKNYEYELLRLCTKFEYMILGGSEKLFNYFIETYNPKSIVSYCDNSKFTGDVYEKLNFKLKDYGNPSKHWFNGERHITDNLLRQRGFDQLFKTNYGKGTSNEELMKDIGFVEIYDCGQSTYIWNNED